MTGMLCEEPFDVLLWDQQNILGCHVGVTAQCRIIGSNNK